MTNQFIHRVPAGVDKSGIRGTLAHGIVPAIAIIALLAVQAQAAFAHGLTHRIPMVTPASHPFLQTFVRIVNRSDRAGAVTIYAIDDTGGRFGPISVDLDENATVHFNSTDLEQGNISKGLSGGVGPGQGNWRLELDSGLDIEALAYMRTGSGFLTSMHDVVAEDAPGVYWVPIFNPGSNLNQKSLLRLINTGSSDADITITGLDDRGMPPPSGKIHLTLPAGESRKITAQQLESGGDDLTGSFGDGSGKWTLFVSSDHSIQVMSILQSSDGNLTNLSRTPYEVVSCGDFSAYAGTQRPLQQEADGQEQTITGHTFVESWSREEHYYLVRFSASLPVPGGEFLAIVSKEVMDNDVAVASLFWHDDDQNGEYFHRRPDRVMTQARLVVDQDDGYLIAPVRPHSTSSGLWRTKDEFTLQRALVEYMADLGVGKFNFYGHGGGGQIALILAGELPLLVKTIGVSSPYDLCTHDYDHSPLERISELPAVPILIVHDQLDKSVDLKNIYTYVQAAEEENLLIRLVIEVTTTDDTPHYGTMALLGRELRKHGPEHRSERIISDGSVSADALEEVREAMAISRAYAKEHLGIAPPGVNVFIGADSEWLTERRLEAMKLGESFRAWILDQFTNCRGDAEAGFTYILLSTCHERWQSGDTLKWSIPHEWWHANVQFYLLNTFCCTDSERMQVLGPEWLIEGSAEVWASLVVNDFNNNLEWEKAWRREQVPADFNLLALNTRKGWREAPDSKYEARDLANWMLLERAGLSSFLDFYQRLGKYIASEATRNVLNSTGQSWQVMRFRNEFFDSPERLQKLDEIFRSSFSLTLEEFADQFSEYLGQR